MVCINVDKPDRWLAVVQRSERNNQAAVFLMPDSAHLYDKIVQRTGRAPIESMLKVCFCFPLSVIALGAFKMWRISWGRSCEVFVRCS